MSRKILALCLALVMLIGSVPLSAMASSTPMYTEAMQKLMASTTDDYAPEQVWNLDEDKTKKEHHPKGGVL